VQIICHDPHLTLQPRLADKRVDVTAGYGGWSEVARPRRRPISFWLGSPGLRMVLPIVFDEYASRGSVEAAIASLEKLATPSGTYSFNPPVVTLNARGKLVPHQDKEWVIDGLTWSDAAIADPKTGNRLRQGVDVSLLEWIQDQRVREESPAKRVKQLSKLQHSKPGAKHKRHTVKRAKTIAVHAGTLDTSDDVFGTGEDLLTIAANELGDASRWIEIAQLNDIRDPRSTYPGQSLRLP
jgi:hypothetical protein